MNKFIEDLLDQPMPQDMVESLTDGVKEIGKQLNEPDSVDVLNNCLIELQRIKDAQVKGMIVGRLLAELPLGLQKIVAQSHLDLSVATFAKTMLKSGNAGDIIKSMLDEEEGL